MIWKGLLEKALADAGFFAGECSPADFAFLAVLRNRAEDVLNKKGHNASLATHALISMMDSRSFCDGPLLAWLDSVAKRMQSPKTVAEAKPFLPKGQKASADATVPSSASEAINKYAARPGNDYLGSGSRNDRRGHRQLVPQGQAAAAADAVVPDVAAGSMVRMPEGQKSRAPAATVLPREPSVAIRAAMLAGRRSEAYSIYDRELGMGGVVVGKAKRPDIINLRKKGILVTSTAERLLTDIDWPDDQTALINCSTAEQVQTIFNAAYRSLDALGVTNVSP